MGSFFSSLLSWFSSSPYSVTIIGKDNAGKTTLSYLLKEHRLSSFSPTVHPQRNDVTVFDEKISLLDLGGSEIQRRTWKDFLSARENQGIVYMFDAADADSFEQQCQIFADAMQFIDSNVPVAVMVNKLDLRQARDYQSVVSRLCSQCRGFMSTDRPVKYFPTSLVNGEGYMDAMQFLLSELRKRGE